MKKGTIRNMVNRILWAEDRGQYTIVVVDRLAPTGLREISRDCVERVDNTYLYLGCGEEDTVIPIHRVVMIKHKGATVWSRASPTR